MPENTSVWKEAEGREDLVEHERIFSYSVGITEEGM